MPKFKLTAIVNTDSMKIPPSVDVNDLPALQEFLETDENSPRLFDLWNIKMERVDE